MLSGAVGLLFLVHRTKLGIAMRATSQNQSVAGLMGININTVISLLVALPAAYAFSRYQFIGDKHVFFWLLTNRKAAARKGKVQLIHAVSFAEKMPRSLGAKRNAIPPA